MKQLLFLVLALPLIASRCGEVCGCSPIEPEGFLEVNIKAVYNAKPLVINEVVDYNGKKMRITKLSFFISSLSARATTDNVGVHLVDFTNFDRLSAAEAGFGLKLPYNIGQHESFGGKIGLPTATNALKPKDFSSSSPLSDASHYWDSWNSYIFTKLEGLLDKDGDGRFETGITLHTGGNEVGQTFNFKKSFTVNENGSTTFSTELNVNELIKGIDLTTTGSTHQAVDLPTMQKFVNNFQTAWVVK
jgi:hypothetical protein